jgi:hypothetical protein
MEGAPEGLGVCPYLALARSARDSATNVGRAGRFRKPTAVARHSTPHALARRSGKPLEARATLEPLVRGLEATPEDLELSALDALAAGDASEGTVDLATRAVFATGHRDADALRTLALIRLARGEVARARALEVEAMAFGPDARPAGAGAAGGRVDARCARTRCRADGSGAAPSKARWRCGPKSDGRLPRAVAVRGTPGR